jgi:hypothetical protein
VEFPSPAREDGTWKCILTDLTGDGRLQSEGDQRCQTCFSLLDDRPYPRCHERLLLLQGFVEEDKFQVWRSAS